MKTIPLLSLLAVSLFIAAPAGAQVIAFGGATAEEAQGVATDASGNVFTVGYFSGTVDFDPSDGADAADTKTATGAGQAGFLASYAPDGSFRFVVPLTGAGGAQPLGVAVDASGNVFVCGAVGGTVDFDGGPGTQNRTGDADGDGFLASYTNTGAFRFAHMLGGTGFTGCFSVATAGNGNIVVTGGFAGSVDVNPGPAAQVFTSSGGLDGYVAGFDGAGNFLHGRQLAGADVYNVAADAAGNAYVCGYFSDSADFDAADGPDASDSLTSAGAQDAFLASYSATGAFRWVVRLGGELSDFGYGVAVDAAGNSFVAGSGYEIDFDPGPATLQLLDTTGFFLASYTSTGALRFAIGEGGSGFGSATPFFASYRDGNVFVGGTFDGTVDLAPGAPGQGGLLSAPEDAGFVARYSAADGSLGYARSFGAGSASVWSVAGTPGGGIAAVGSFTDTGDFDPGAGVVEKTSAGEEDGYVLLLTGSGNYPGATTGGLQVTNTDDSGPGSLREALDTANATPTPDTVTFAIPGAGPHVIRPASPLPVISTPVTLDGFSQPGASGDAWPPTLKIVLDGTLAGANANGLAIASNAVGAVTSVKGLVVRNFSRYGVTVGGKAEITQCYVGANPDGATAAGNGAGGIFVDGDGLATSGGALAFDIRIGLPGRGNLISGNTGPGVFLEDARGVAVRGNFIGTTSSGSAPLPNTDAGVLVEGTSLSSATASELRIGGTAAGEGNRIAFNQRDGVSLGGSTARADVLGNSISDNTGLGIDHWTVTRGNAVPGVNDPADADDDLPNGLANHPVLRSAVLHGGKTTVTGMLDGLGGESFRLEFFSSPAADASAHGEGATYLGTAGVRCESGPAKFSVELPATTPGHAITATATSLRTKTGTSEGTSEFSRAVTVAAATVTTLADSGAGSLRAAIAAANASPGADVITLAPMVAGGTVFLSSELPTFTGPLTLRGDGVVLSGRNLVRVLSVNAPSQTVTLEDVTVADGSASGNGGGILLTNGTLELARCVIDNCASTGSGGGLALAGGTANLDDCRVTRCRAATDGGGVAKLGGTFSGDRCTIDHCVAGVRGGGLFANGVVFIRNCTFSGNEAATGGGLNFTGTSGGRFEFCTFVHNTATTAGGVAGSNIIFANNIVALNTAATDPQMPNPDDYDGRNLIGGDPLIGPLRDNGGCVPTHALLTGSPARNRVTSTAFLTGTDARLAPRKNDFTSVADFGAFEYFTGPFAEFPRNYAAWRVQAGAGAADADDNGDGLRNLAAHFLGVPVRGTGRAGWAVRRDESGANLVLSFERPFTVLDSTATSEVSGTLSAWTTGPAPVEVGSTIFAQAYEVRIPLTTPRGHVRLRIAP